MDKLLGLNYKRNRNWFYKGTIVILLLGVSIIFPLALNYKRFNAGAQFQSDVYQKVRTVFEQSKNFPAIQHILIQGNGVILTIEPFPEDKAEERRLKTELEQATGLQVFLQSSLIGK